MESGSPLFMFLLLGLMMIILIVLPARRAKKAQQQLKERQETMVPGTKVMTNFGLFGTLDSLDREQNVAYLEIAPGTVVKVHLMTVTTIEESNKPAEKSAAQTKPTLEGQVADDPAN
ncbi:preprotein translocase subunit YajC [Rothia sp. P5766]|uniref:preprotein translocase subunit YajC n=1 Tax=Rothia sp. P5766 TaxID=3402656 RepID=UPI003AEEBAF3